MPTANWPPWTLNGMTLLELVIRLFTDRLLAAVRRGLPRRYLAHEEDFALLRGRLNVKRQFTHLATFFLDRLACRFDELSEDMSSQPRLQGRGDPARRYRSFCRQHPAVGRARRSLRVRAPTTPDPLGESVQLDRTNTAFPRSLPPRSAFSGRKTGRVPQGVVRRDSPYCSP